MKHPRTHRVTATSSPTPRRRVRKNEAPRSKLRGILRNSPKPLPSFAKAPEGSPRLHTPQQDTGHSAKENNRTEVIRSPKPATHPGEPIDHCYRALLETSSSAILLLSPESIILGWNRAVESVSGWRADEALGRSYVELCLPMEARESFLTELARVTTGSESG